MISPVCAIASRKEVLGKVLKCETLNCFLRILSNLIQFFTRRNIRRYSDHPILESETDFHVQENPLKITAPGNNLGSYLLHKGDILIVR